MQKGTVMDKTGFYTILDIDNAEEFQYYENIAAMIEADDYIESNLIKDLLKDVDPDNFAELTDSYFEELLKMLPDEETDLYITVESIKRILCGLITPEMNPDDAALLADEFIKMRKWFVHDLLAFDMNTGEEISVRDAIYNIAATKYIGGEKKYDFRLACNYDTDGYDVRFADMIDGNLAEEEPEA